jgi:ABC-type polysaccharide/polyol phosphate transport system ATPase subunit
LQFGKSANQILIVDEVLAVGDAEFQKKCLGKMKDLANRADSQRLTTIVPIA